ILNKLLASVSDTNTNTNTGTDSSTYEALWRLARAYRWEAEKAPASGGERMNLLEKAKNYAEKATKANEQGADGHYWLGVIMGRIGEERGVLNSLFLIKPIKQEMEKVLAIDPKYAGAHHVLGVLYRKAPSRPLSIGDIKKALQEATLAVQYAPADTLYRVGLAEVHIALKEYDKARSILEEAIKMPPTPGDEPAGEMDKATARELLKQIEKK
ncbi:MAG: tetratricopeptide repeat protein, partial [Syntrophothermus sp.]